MSIGMFENEQFAEQLEEQKIYLKQGDLLLLYSDGVTEATNPENLMFDVAGLKTVISECTPSIPMLIMLFMLKACRKYHKLAVF